MPWRVAKPTSNSFGVVIGQTLAHSPQPEQSFVTYRGFFRTLTLKLPMYPLTSWTSLLVSNSMFGCLPASDILGASMQIEQSIVGKVLSSCAILPPILGSRSTRYTL